MRFKDVFSIIGPAMVGPSSSHTAGAARIGRAARRLFGELPARADISLFGSFAATYRGHGTDTALVGGLLDMRTDDPRLPDAFRHAEECGLHIDIQPGKGLYPHPNTAELKLASADGSRERSVLGTSIGGGNIEIVRIDGFNVKLTALYPTLVLLHRDEPGFIADTTRLLASEGINIGHMSVDRKSRRGAAMTVLELDGAADVNSASIIETLGSHADIREVRWLDLNED
jgi:L-serine dehydratase, iron-sulfur-dependent, beta subunit